LRENLQFWQDIGASSWILNIIRCGYCLPFIEQPEHKLFNNHASAINNSDFVSCEMNKLLVSRAFRRVASFKCILQQIIDSGFVVSARQLAKFTGSLSSMGLALGAIVRLWTRVS
jgi:hypothetical protein